MAKKIKGNDTPTPVEWREELEKVDSLDETERGENGFGSTGR